MRTSVQLRSAALTEEEGELRGEARFLWNHRVFRGNCGEIGRCQLILKDKHFLSENVTEPYRKIW